MTTTDRRLCLRTCRPGGLSRNDFVWPLEPGATVEAPDWDPTPVCGHGLHGLLRGEGQGSLLDWSDDAVWLVVEPRGEVVDLSGKVKFASAAVVYAGERDGAVALLQEEYPGAAVIGGTATAGYRGTATAGDGGTATAGDRGTLMIRWWSLSADRERTAIGYVGEDGIEPSVAYRVEGQGQLAPVEPAEEQVKTTEAAP